VGSKAEFNRIIFFIAQPSRRLPGLQGVTTTPPEGKDREYWEGGQAVDLFPNPPEFHRVRHIFFFLAFLSSM
jgi:hypothetical protein